MSLVGRLLLAKPELGDPNFAGTVTLMLAHDDEGAMGLVVNRPAEGSVDALDAVWGDRLVSPAGLFHGGPVGIDGVVALAHDPDASGPLPFGLWSVDPGGPDEDDASIDRVRLFLGHAGWGPGQLEGEIGAGAWWTAEGSADVAFDADPTTLWRRIVRALGGDLAIWSTFTDDPSVN